MYNNYTLLILWLYLLSFIFICVFSAIKKPSFFYVVLKQLENYIVTIMESTNINAVKTVSLFNTFKIL